MYSVPSIEDGERSIFEHHKIKVVVIGNDNCRVITRKRIGVQLGLAHSERPVIGLDVIVDS